MSHWRDQDQYKNSVKICKINGGCACIAWTPQTPWSCYQGPSGSSHNFIYWTPHHTLACTWSWSLSALCPYYIRGSYKVFILNCRIISKNLDLIIYLLTHLKHNCSCNGALKVFLFFFVSKKLTTFATPSTFVPTWSVVIMNCENWKFFTRFTLRDNGEVNEDKPWGLRSSQTMSSCFS